MVSLTVILFSTKPFLFVYMYIDLSKLKASRLFENSDADLSFLKKPTCILSVNEKSPPEYQGENEHNV